MDQKGLGHIAKLARLKLEASEMTSLNLDLEKILMHFEMISQVPTEGITPLVTPLDELVSLREDVVSQDLTVGEIMQNAPDKVGNLFKVPPVV